jgi:hypothetical protein
VEQQEGVLRFGRGAAGHDLHRRCGELPLGLCWWTSRSLLLPRPPSNLDLDLSCCWELCSIFCLAHDPLPFAKQKLKSKKIAKNRKIIFQTKKK